MNAKSRKWDMKTILLVLIIAVLTIAVIFVVFVPSNEKNTTPSALNVQELWQNRESYVGKNITVEGFYYLWGDGSHSLIPATTDSNPNPTVKINLDESSLNLAKKAANITVSSNLKYRVVGVLQKGTSTIAPDFKIIVESIKAV
jgi:flagellar basal body-associated protein FliL